MLKIHFRCLVISCQSSEMAAQTTFPKKDGKICALVPQKARAWAVTSLEININSFVDGRYCTFLASKIHHLRLDENGWLHITTKTKRNHF